MTVVGLIFTLIVPACVLGYLLPYVPRAARRAGRAVQERAHERRALDPASSPAYAGHPPAEVGLAVALFGGPALFALDRDFAARAGVARRLGQYPSQGSSSSGSGCGSFGCGGCGL
ncbi:uncharacterized protein (TIGR04222 family) [Actinocorallia herbida]|uniref:Uncharacterized protein (TIGR04222 family) n=1 Tax=Actinocorallia herbida TaxID=58109 RepID=A0A3N1CRC3_9ACTN|nr:hypothetical protein [Actinocorallia herbida]ROO83859.1 uncharacterized protein (TIGR04222 family) [Actinocorallia herbida]